MRVDVRPILLGSRSLRRQIELVVEQLGDRADTAYDMVEEWLEEFGYLDAAERARLDLPAADARPLERWHVAILRGLLLQPDHLVCHCPPDAPERNPLEGVLERIRRRYPQRRASFSDAA